MLLLLVVVSLSLSFRLGGVAIPYSSGMLLLLLAIHWMREDGWLAEQLSRNPLFIGNAFATVRQLPALPPPHHVAIPYSSGMLLLQQRDQRVLADVLRLVAIPYSSGMLLLQPTSGYEGWKRRDQ